MSFNYSSLADSASSLLQKFGRQYTFTRVTKGTFNPATGQAAETSSTFTKYGCLFDYSDRDSAGQTIQAGDRRMLAEGYEYEVGDTVSVDGDIYRVISVSQNKPSGTSLVANLQVRK